MTELSPVIGERLRDTLGDIAGVASLGAFRVSRLERKAIREDLVMRALMPMARRRGATILEIERAKKSAIAQLEQDRTMAWAIRCGELELPRARQRARRPTSPTPPEAG